MSSLIRDGAAAGRGRFFTRGGRIAVTLFAVACVALMVWGMVYPRQMRVEYSVGWTFTLTGSDNIGGRYNASISHYNVTRYNDSFGRDEISYRFNGSLERGPFIPTANRTMAWIKNNTANGSLFLSWWPYGHMIRGMAERESIIFAPSREISDTVVFPERVVRWEKPERVKDVANAFLATDLNITREVMNKYLAYYILVEKDGITFIDAFCKATGQDPDDYARYEPGPGFGFVGAGTHCAMQSFINGTDTPGFEKVYEDDVFLVFKLAG